MRGFKTKILGVLLSVALISTQCPVASFASEQQDDALQSSTLSADLPSEEEIENSVPDQLIVTYKDSSIGLDEDIDVADVAGDEPEEIAVSQPDSTTTLNDLGAVEEGSIDDGSAQEDAGESALVTFEEGTDLREVAAQLLSSPEVESVQPNYKYDLFAVGSTSYYDASGTKAAKHPTNDPYSLVNASNSLNQSYIYSTKIADAWDAGYGVSGKVSVAVIDTGPRLDHPDLAAAFDTTYSRDFSTTSYGNGVPYYDSPSNWEGRTGNECHSTWVSGILGATANNNVGIAGSSYNAKIIPIKVTDGQTFSTTTLVRAYSYLDTLIESGKLPTLKVINLSLGGRYSDSMLLTAINHMANTHNILTVASAGNYGTSAAVYPADYTNVLSVMATNNDFTRAYFSSYRGKDVSAPGVSITSTIPWSSTWSTTQRGKYQGSGISGTSFSAPMVSGVAAMCYAAKPTATAKEVRYAIKTSATSISSIDSTCAPLLNGLQAVKDILSGKALYEATHTSIASAKVSSMKTRLYTGKRLIPRPKVTLGTKVLKRGVDYTLTYSNNLNPGTATITIKGIGSYKNSTKVTFKIIPKATTIKRLTAQKTSIKVRWTKRSSCATGYEIRYSAFSTRSKTTNRLKSGRNVYVSGKSKVSKTLKKLKRRKTYYVQVRVYKKKSGTYYYSKWTTPKKVKTL